jgi:hypothetical protein
VKKLFSKLFSRYVVIIYWEGKIIRHRSYTLRDAREWVQLYECVNALPYIRRRY